MTGQGEHTSHGGNPSHFEAMAAAYAGARPDYPAIVFETLRKFEVIGKDKAVLEIGAGTGEATSTLVGAGCRVTAVEPGPRLAGLLAERVPQANVVAGRIEDLDLPACAFDAVLAATAMHWVDLTTTLPQLHRALRPRGRLAVWRTTFGDASVATPFRRRLHEIVSRRAAHLNTDADVRGIRPTMRELVATGHFAAHDSWEWPWSIRLTADQIAALFLTFSDWSADEVAQARAAVHDLGGSVVEHYRTILHLLDRVPDPVISTAG